MDSSEKDIVEGHEGLSLNNLIKKFTYHWPLFVMSFIVCLAAGYIYFRYSVPVYEVKAAIIIKDERKGAGYNVLKELDLVDKTVVQETEMELLKSKSLVGQAVHELELYVRYIEEGRVKKSDIYDETPIHFKILTEPTSFYGKEIEVQILNDGKYSVIFPDGNSVQTKLNETQTFKQAKWKLEKNGQASKDIAGDYIKIKISDPAAVTSNFQERLKVGFTNKSKAVVGLSIEEINAKRGIDFLNKLIEVYNVGSINDKNQVAKNTMAFLDERLSYLTSELSLIEKEVEQYKSSKRITDISSESQLYLEAAKDKDNQLNSVKFKIQVLEEISRYINTSSVTEPMPAIFGIDDAILQAQLSSFNMLLAERERMLATAGPKSPLLEIKEQQIHSARKAIEENLISLRNVLEASERELESQSHKIESSIRQIPTIEREFISIKRQQTIKEQLYLFLLQKREEAGLTYASAVADSKMVDTAHTTNIPVSPRKSLVIQLSLALGLILPFSYIYLKDLLNNKVISLEDLRKLSQIPLLGGITYKQSDSNIMITPQSKSTIAEQFRAIRTNLHYIHGKENEFGRVSLVTSSISGEGKTFFAVNMAISLSIANRKVILLEMDLRKPKLSKYLGLENNHGLSQYLVGLTSLEAVIRKSGVHENLDVISSGPVPPNPSEMLMGTAMDQLIGKLKQEYDDIIIDTAPIGLVADAQIISRFANATIFIIRHGYSHKSQVNSIEVLYRENKLPGMSIVLNGVNMGGRFGYGYGSGYGYGKDYGYFEDNGEDHGIVKRMWNLLKRV